MNQIFKRASLVLGEDKIDLLNKKRVIVFGAGGVGGNVIEALVRTGIGEISIVDYDVIDITNVNRQVIATSNNIGNSKAEEFKKRMLDINPDCKVKAINKCFTLENKDEFNIESYDYVIDAIDMMKSKIELICLCKEKNVPIISALGAGNKIDPTQLEVSDIYKTSVDPLGKILRKELRLRGIKDLKVVYSKESPKKNESKEIGSLIWTTASMGLLIAKEVVMDLIK